MTYRRGALILAFTSAVALAMGYWGDAGALLWVSGWAGGLGFTLWMDRHRDG